MLLEEITGRGYNEKGEAIFASPCRDDLTRTDDPYVPNVVR